MNENKKGYWIYSTIVVIFSISFFAYALWLICYLIYKLSTAPITNGIILQSIVTLFMTVILGGYFSKWLEHRNAKKLELYKIRTAISLSVIDLASEYYHHKNEIEIRNQLISESSKVKLYFDNEVLISLNEYLSSEEIELLSKYEELINKLKSGISK